MGIRTRIKFCGITREVDALAAVALGVDALGFVFYPPSPRYLTALRARAIVAELPPFVCAVGLFVDAPLAQVQDVADSVQLNAVQFHGDESPDYCARSGLSFVKAIRLETGALYGQAEVDYAGARGLLLDSYHAQLVGGTGLSFDWSLIPAQRAKPIILAGGLHAANVGDAIRRVGPHAVDVSGGIEAAKGIKDYSLMQAFVAEVRAVECDQYS